MIDRDDVDGPFYQLLKDLDADRLAWEKEHFGDDKAALAAHYDYCLKVAMGIDEGCKWDSDKDPNG